MIASSTAESKPSVEADLDHESDVLLVAFGGFGGELGMPIFEFTNFTSRFEAKRLFIRDIQQGWYQFGLTGIAPHIGGVADYIRGVAEKERASRLVFIGNSMGGYAALLFGSMVGAAEVHAFSPQTYITPMRRLLTGDLRWRKAMQKIHRSAHADRTYWDLRPLLEKSNTTTRYHVHYSTRDRLDAIHAKRMARCNGVEVHAYPEGGHELVRALRDSGRLASLLTDAGVPPKSS